MVDDVVGGWISDTVGDVGSDGDIVIVAGRGELRVGRNLRVCHSQETDYDWHDGVPQQLQIHSSDSLLFQRKAALLGRQALIVSGEREMLYDYRLRLFEDEAWL